MYGEEEGEQPIGSYAIFFAEGESLAKQGQYLKAIDSFTKVWKHFIIQIVKYSYRIRHLSFKQMIRPV